MPPLPHWGARYSTKEKRRYRPNRRPVLAKIIISIWKFGKGIINISQHKLINLVIHCFFLFKISFLCYSLVEISTREALSRILGKE